MILVWTSIKIKHNVFDYSLEFTLTSEINKTIQLTACVFFGSIQSFVQRI